MIGRGGLIGLAVATAAMTAAAVAVSLGPPGTATVEPGARLLPGLAERIDDAAVISVRTARDAFTIRRDGDGQWVQAQVSDKTATKLEDAILTRARQLRIGAAR